MNKSSIAEKKIDGKGKVGIVKDCLRVGYCEEHNMVHPMDEILNHFPDDPKMVDRALQNPKPQSEPTMTTEEKKRTYKQTLALVKKMQKKLSAPPETGREWGKRIEFVEVNGKHWLNEEQIRKMLAFALAKGEKIGAEKERARLSGWLMHDDNCKGLYFDPKKTSKCDCGLADALKG